MISHGRSLCIHLNLYRENVYYYLFQTNRVKVFFFFFFFFFFTNLKSHLPDFGKKLRASKIEQSDDNTYILVCIIADFFRDFPAS